MSDYVWTPLGPSEPEFSSSPPPRGADRLPSARGRTLGPQPVAIRGRRQHRFAWHVGGCIRKKLAGGASAVPWRAIGRGRGDAEKFSAVTPCALTFGCSAPIMDLIGRRMLHRPFVLLHDGRSDIRPATSARETKARPTTKLDVSWSLTSFAVDTLPPPLHSNLPLIWFALSKLALGIVRPRADGLPVGG